MTQSAILKSDIEAHTGILGHGIYSVTEASRLVGASRSDIGRWVFGASNAEPLWRSRYEAPYEAREISFHEMMETRVIKKLRKIGLSLQSIRFALTCAQDKFGVCLPLSSQFFRTDGTEILMQAANQDELYSLSRKRPGQQVFGEIVEQSFLNVEFDGMRPALWRPASGDAIIVDPERLFGAPMLDAFGVSTRTLAEEHARGVSFSAIGKLYEVPTSLVREAIAFEKRLDGQTPV